MCYYNCSLIFREKKKISGLLLLFPTQQRLCRHGSHEESNQGLYLWSSEGYNEVQKSQDLLDVQIWWIPYFTAFKGIAVANSSSFCNKDPRCWYLSSKTIATKQIGFRGEISQAFVLEYIEKQPERHCVLMRDFSLCSPYRSYWQPLHPPFMFKPEQGNPCRYLVWSKN